VFTLFASFRLPPRTHSFYVLSSPSSHLSPLTVIFVLCVLYWFRDHRHWHVGLRIVIHQCYYCEGVVGLGSRFLFYCWFYSFVLRCWWKSKRFDFLCLISVLGFGVCGGWSKGLSFMWFLMEKEAFIVGFTVLFLVVDGKVKVRFMVFDFPFGVCGGWRKSSSFIGCLLKRDDIFYGLWCLDVFVSSMYGVVCWFDIVDKDSTKVIPN